MKKKELEIFLQSIPGPLRPLPQLEQYMTPAGIAADILFTAYQFQDIQNKKVLDLGCGTGIFSVGAALMGAKKVIGVDIDRDSIYIARAFAEDKNLPIEFVVQDVKDVVLTCDTVLMNPPFGAQKSNQQADRKFLEKGFECAEILYTLHLSITLPFIEKMVSSLHGKITMQKHYNLPIKGMFSFHRKKMKTFAVDLLRIQTK